MQPITLSSDEIEVACDALWFARFRGGLDGVGAALWERLQPLRQGDYGGSGSVVLTAAEVPVVRAALERVESGGGMDLAERALAQRLQG